jgi:hypothetical protein
MRAIIVVLILAIAGQTAHAEKGDPWDGTTIALEVGGGTAGGLVGGVALGLTGAGMGYLLDRKHYQAPLAAGLIGALAGMFTGTIVGVHMVGDARGLDGRPWTTVIGATVGTAATASYAFFLAKGGRAWAAEAVLGYFIFLTPTIIGYQLGAETEDGSAERVISLPMLGGSF